MDYDRTVFGTVARIAEMRTLMRRRIARRAAHFSGIIPSIGVCKSQG